MNAVVKPLKAAPSRPTIEVKAGTLPQMVDQSMAALGTTMRVFDRGEVLVSLNQRSGATAPLTAATCRVEMARAARWVKMTKDLEDGWKQVSTDPPRPVATALVDMTSWDHIPKLNSVVDHTLWLAPGRAHPGGFDQETGIYCTARQPADPARSDASRAEAEEALSTLREAIQTFPWAAPEDEAAALTAMLAAACRPALDHAPLILCSAPESGSGKAVLAHAIAQMAWSQKLAGAVLPADDEQETRKMLLSKVLGGDPVVLFDEVGKGSAGVEIDSPSLRMLATAELFSGRVLGLSKDAKAPTALTVLITANNAVPSSDSSRRILEIRLNPKCEHPSERRFKGPKPVAIIKSRRDEFIRAVMTIQSAYWHAGRPGLDDLPPTSDFTQWTEWCRAPIAWLLGVDPAKRLIEATRENRGGGELAEVLRVIHERLGSTPWKVAALLDQPLVMEALSQVLPARPGMEPTPRQVGRWLVGVRERVADGLMLRQAHGKAQGSLTWMVTRA